MPRCSAFFEGWAGGVLPGGGNGAGFGVLAFAGGLVVGPKIGVMTGFSPVFLSCGFTGG